MHNNAKKLKSSRKYHSAGCPSTESFEDQVMRIRDDGFWQAKDSLGTIESAQTALPPEHRLPEIIDPHQKSHSFKISRHQLFHSSKTVRRSEPVPALPLDPRLRKVPYNPRESEKAKSVHRQKKLASDVTRLLQVKEEISNTEAAAVRFFDAFEEGVPVEGSGLIKELTDAAAQLSKACQLENKFETSEKVVDIVLSYGPIDEDIFDALGVKGIVTELVCGSHGGAAGDIEIEVSRLRKAAALYLTKFKEKPRTASNSWRSLGETLCSTACRYALFDLTEALYWRMEQCCGDAPNRSVHHLMTALYKQESYKKVIKLFRRFSSNTRPKQGIFYTMGDIVIESSLKVRRLDLAEEALATLAKMSEDGEVQCSTTWFLKVLGSDWRTHRDISRTRALFERLAPHFHVAALPQAPYGIIIQFCIEAGDEAAARSYYDYRLEKAQGQPTENELRIYGHFAYAKAMRNDWTGVKEDFRKMRELSPDKHEFSASFTPILKLFAKSHPVNETEEFLRTFVEHQYVALTPYMSTTMINKYAEAKEIDSILRWLDYMISVRSPADPMFFNAIIHNCRKKWKFSFHETYNLFLKVRKMGGSAAKFINMDTVSILRRAAIAGAGKNIAGAVRSLNRLKLDQPLRIPVDSESVQELMATALAKGDPGRALRIYERAQNNIVPLDAACISTAVKASLQVDPNDIHTAASLLRKSQTDGRDISVAVSMIFNHQLSYQYHDTKHIRVQEMARDTVAALEDRGITVSVRMITHTTHTLVNQGQYRQAIEFWNSISHSQKTPTSLDLPTLTVLLRAYIGVRDCVGIEWAIQMLSINSLVPDELFKRPLKAALREIRKLLEANECGYSDRQFYNVVKNALKSVSAMRFEAIKDKEDVKIKTIKIMEKAIEIERTLNLGAEGERVRKGATVIKVSDSEKSSNLPIEGPVGACNWIKSEESDHGIAVPPLGRLVGVNAA